jgi:uroporphyrinogen-III synthase
MGAAKAARHAGGRPPLPPEERRARVDLRLPPETLARLDELAAAAGETRTDTIVRLVELAFRRRRR